MAEAKNEKRIGKRIAIAVAAIVIVLGGVFAWYVNDYSHADATALAAVADTDGAADGVTVHQIEGGAVAFAPEHPWAGFIFYPGAKVQPEAYASLLTRCARSGVLCVLVKPLFNLAILDADAAEGVRGQFPEIGTWLIGGHSMGGVAAADYAARHTDDFDAIVFLASYPASDLSNFGGRALSIVGSEDGVLNRDKAEAAADKMPARSTEIVIEGGNHAGFGNYGEQANDNPATIPADDQQEQTAQAIAAVATAE